MHSFLKDTAHKVLADYPALDQVILVLPNRRAGLFIAKHLGNLIDKPQWMPQIRTIEEVFYAYANNKPADQLTLIFELYKVYFALHPKAETFDRFYYWGEMILRDFKDLDNFLVDAEKLYHQLEEIKVIENDFDYLTENQIKLIREFWKSFEIKDKAHQEKFLKFWKQLRPIYQNFQTALSVSGLAYSGMLYRQVVEQLDQLSRPVKQYVFIGFNAFSLTEEKLIKHFIKEFGADIFWDLDSYYLEDPRQEAGLFFRDYRKDKILGPTFPGEIMPHIRGIKAKIHVHATPLKINQANLVGKLMENIGAEETLEQTVVILPDEQLLFPTLHSLPETIDMVNVTMGYPVKNAPAYGFLESLLDLQKYVSMKEGQIVFYHKPVRGILASTYFRSMNNEFVIRELRTIEETNQIYIPAARLAAGGELFKLVFDKVEAGDLFPFLKKVIKALVNLLDLPELQQTYLYQCYKQLTRLDELFHAQGDITIGLDFFMRLFKQVFREVRLPFEGEPLEGLQVMGVLESRNLDFKRVIICNMNEGSFPPSSAMNSMVPFNLRRAFGLPVQEQNDAIYAYTFYRLLHSAEEIHLIYTTESDEGKAGEKSRYIQQLALESGLEVKEETVFIPVDLQQGNPIIIPKNQKILEILGKYEVKQGNEKQERLSPSAINVWLDCRLKFYFQHVAGIRERDDVQEKIDPAVFGNLAHYSLEFLYKGFKERKGRFNLAKEDFAELRENWIGPSVELAIKKHFSVSEKEAFQLSGQLIIARDVLQRYIHRLLEVDESYAPFEIISLEGSKDYFANIPITLSKEEKLIGLKGIIDRVDRIGGTIRLIDYKSGADKKDFTDIPSLFDRDNKSRNKAAMQTMMYGLLYQETSGGKVSNPLKPAVFNLKDIFNEEFSPYLQMGVSRRPKEEIASYQEYEEQFLSALEDCLSELFDPDIPFDQTEEEEKCEQCPFKAICAQN
ncbi:MAG: PD-(D/E)XK nuclease family protein [Anditalea sp.]